MGKLYSLISALLISLWSPVAYGQTGYEWWLDNDVSGRKSGTISGDVLNMQVEMSGMPEGLHGFNCRINRADGTWGAVYRQMVLIPSSPRLQMADTYEYWIDDNRASKVSGSLSTGTKTYTVDLQGLPQGLHRFNYRVGIQNGDWGAPYSQHFFVPASDSKSDAVAEAYEYWIDDDYASKVSGSLSAGANAYTVDLQDLPQGLHRFNYRVRTQYGDWGAPYSQYFYNVIESHEPSVVSYEYWLDNDFAARKTGILEGNQISLPIDLSGYDKTGDFHCFNIRLGDNQKGWGAVYRKLLVFQDHKDDYKVVGYRHRVNGIDLGYVEVEGGLTNPHSFIVDLPEEVVSNSSGIGTLAFNGNTVSTTGNDSIHYSIQVKSAMGWSAPKTWDFALSRNFSTTAVEMAVNSSHVFDVPASDKFAAMKFTATGDSLYFRSDVPVALDIYKSGEKVYALTAEQVKGMAMLKLTAGEYFGVLHSVEDAEAQNFTLHLMDTPNQVPVPHISYENETVNITCSRQDATIRYTLDGKDPYGESTLFTEPFQMKRNGTIKAKAWVDGSDITPSAVAAYTIDTYKTAAPVAEFDLPARLLNLTSETNGAIIRYTFEYDRTDSLGGVWTDYENQIQIRKNCTVYSRASFDGYKDSDITVTEITTLPDSVPMPVIEFNEGIVTISCAERDAEIHYTLDGTRPTGGSTRYAGAFPLRRNATVMAMAFVPGLDIDSSRVATRVVDSYKVATPRGSFDVSTRLLTLTCDTVGASIFHKFDSEGEWTPYSATERIRMRKNGTVYAKATYDGYNDSDVAEIVVSELPNAVVQPEILCDGNIVNGSAVVVIRCATEGAAIRYTFDDEEPSMESTLYEREFSITRNIRVNAFAYIPDLDLEPSNVSSILCDVFHVEDLRYNFDPDTRELKIECDTEGATILYTSDPNGEWTEYTGPIQIRKNCTLYAKAVRDGYHDSETATITINSLADSVPVPEISFENGKVEISCPNEAAEIHYTVDDPDLTAESPRYTEPFDLNRNAIIRAFALIPGLDIEPSDIVTKVIDSFKVAEPTGNFDVARRELTLSCGTENAKIYYSFVAETEDWTEYTAPISITRNRNVYAKATREGWNDSEVAQIRVTELADNVPAPEISFTDGKVEITCANSAAEIHYTVDDPNLTVESPLYTGPFDLDRNATIRAFALIPGLDIEPSDIETKVINSYKVEDPTGSFDVTRRELTLSCATENAKIYYSFVADTQDWTEYTAPISITRNRTVYAKATREGWNDSEVTPIEVNELADNVPAPEITFTDGKVEITCANTAAEIHYTIDDPNLTAESPLYTGPFDLDRNATIRAFALIPGLDIEPSEVETLVINSYKVEDPTGSFDVTRRELTLSCGTENSKIYYSFVADAEDWTEYSAPISITRNRNVYAKATREGWNDSEVAQIRVTELADNVPAPEISFTDGKVEITCANTAAEIHYTIDDPNLTAESPLYTGPFDLDRNATIRAFALIPGLDIEPSEVETLVINSYKVEDPTGSFDVTRRELTLSCATENAKIYYSFVADTEDWTEYSAPISITRNRNVYAKASREGWNDSDVASIRVTELADNVPTPEITFTDGKVEITCANSAAEIHYTVDDPNLTAESPLYTGPFDLDRNATIRAFALIPGLDIEPSEPVTYVVDSYKVATPYGRFDSESRMLSILCDTENADISYSFDLAATWIPYEDMPILVESNGTVYAMATRDGYNDSEIGEIVISDVKCADVTFGEYHGRYVSLATQEEGAVIRYTTDGSEPSGGQTYTGAFDPEGLCRVRAVAVKEGYMNSDIAELVIDRYADEEHAETSAEGLLASAFGWDDTGIAGRIEDFRVEGQLNTDDYTFLRSMDALRHLDLEKVSDAHIPENAFRDSRLISISLPEDLAECGDSILSGGSLLSSVVWNSRIMNVGEGLTRGLANPNVLLYVPAETSVTGRTDLNIVREGSRPDIKLRYGYPYYAARDFRAARVSLTHEFTQTTKSDTCRGWETIVLPFSPTEITHEDRGPIVPFTAWNEDVEGEKPFWLFSATTAGWVPADYIESSVPYIISMPNNPKYVQEFNLGGKVTYSAENVDLGPESSSADSHEWVQGMLFEGTFMPVSEPTLHSLNVNSTEGGLQPGSKFVPGGTTPPFGAYVSGAPRSRAIPLFGDQGLVGVPLIVDAGLLIETPAPGVLRICSGRECKVAVTTATGVTLRTLHLMPGEAQTLEGLTRDLYIVAGRKVMVR